MDKNHPTISNNKHGWIKFTGLIILISNFEASTVLVILCKFLQLLNMMKAF
jgi:hypothetical protein